MGKKSFTKRGAKDAAASVTEIEVPLTDDGRYAFIMKHSAVPADLWLPTLDLREIAEVVAHAQVCHARAVTAMCNSFAPLVRQCTELQVARCHQPVEFGGEQTTKGGGVHIESL